MIEVCIAKNSNAKYKKSPCQNALNFSMLLSAAILTADRINGLLWCPGDSDLSNASLDSLKIWKNHGIVNFLEGSCGDRKNGEHWT